MVCSTPRSWRMAPERWADARGDVDERRQGVSAAQISKQQVIEAVERAIDAGADEEDDKMGCRQAAEARDLTERAGMVWSFRSWRGVLDELQEGYFDTLFSDLSDVTIFWDTRNPKAAGWSYSYQDGSHQKTGRLDLPKRRDATWEDVIAGFERQLGVLCPGDAQLHRD